MKEVQKNDNEYRKLYLEVLIEYEMDNTNTERAAVLKKILAADIWDKVLKKIKCTKKKQQNELTWIKVGEEVVDDNNWQVLDK